MQHRIYSQTIQEMEDKDCAVQQIRRIAEDAILAHQTVHVEVWADGKTPKPAANQGYLPFPPAEAACEVR